jgi:hypothetical protein
MNRFFQKFGFRFIKIDNGDFVMFGIVYGLDSQKKYSHMELWGRCKYFNLFTKWYPGRLEQLRRKSKWKKDKLKKGEYCK